MQVQVAPTDAGATHLPGAAAARKQPTRGTHRWHLTRLSSLPCCWGQPARPRRAVVAAVGGGSSGASCAADGSSSSYTESITTKSGVSVRKIVSTGCPNHESYCTGKPGNKPTCDEEEKKGLGTEATEQSLSVEVPLNPKLKNSFTAGELDCSMGTVAYALNGVGFYSGAVAFDSGGNCPQLDVAGRPSGSHLIAVPGTARARQLPLPFPAVDASAFLVFYVRGTPPVGI